MLVYVLNNHNKPLMPCSPARARHLLKGRKAEVVNMEPFTIQLLYGSSGYIQPITLGVDPGYRNVGLSAVTDKQELYRSEVELRTDIPRLLEKRRMFRRARRKRKTRYRKPRFLNRSRQKGWLPPSVQHKLDTHVRLVNMVKNILPITDVIVEVANFDIQKIKNPGIEGEGYQQGDQLGFWNVREYVLYRDNHTCRHCNGKSGDKILQTHHIASRGIGGDSPDNLLTMCKTCHEDYHEGRIKLKIKRSRSFRAETFMSTIRWKLINEIESKQTYGYITKHNRIKIGLQNSHVNDAFVIAGGTEDMERSDVIYIQKQVRRNNRKLFKGYHSEIPNKCEREVFGFRLFDRVLFEGEKYFVWARRKTGQFRLKGLSGDKTERIYKKLKKIQGQFSFLIESRFTPVLKNGDFMEGDLKWNTLMRI